MLKQKPSNASNEIYHESKWSNSTPAPMTDRSVTWAVTKEKV